MKVVHLSKTPLACSPGRMSFYLNQIGISSSHFFEQDYPGELQGKMTMGSFHFNSTKESIELLESHLAKADIIHVHNHISASLVALVNKVFSGNKIIFHAHSPLREGPLFTDVSLVMDLEFTDYYVVAQYQPRHYQEYTPICNIVPGIDGFNDEPSASSDVFKIIYSPAHSRAGGRWNPKGSSALNVSLQYCVSQKLAELKSPPKTNEAQLLAYRNQCDITIDEIITGSYHQISLEGLSAGNIVVNNADFFSIEMLKLAAKTDENPPFYHMNESNCSNRLEQLVMMSEQEVTERKQKSREYFTKYLNPERLAGLLAEKYERK